MSDLDLPDRRELIAQQRTGSTAYRLGSRKGRNVVVGVYHHHERWLVKRVDPDRHAYRERPGIGWNLELIATLDRVRPRPRGLAVNTSRQQYAVPWNVVVRYALLAQAGDSRYLITDDVDRQVLIPWEVLEGTETVPPIPEPVLDGSAFRKSRQPTTQPGPTLLDELDA